MRELKFFEAIREAIDQSLSLDRSVYLMGLGIPDPKGIFGTTLGLQKKFGSHRVMDMPASENAMTGIAVGSAVTGMRPIMTHQRIDFALLAMEQVINQAAKWHYMFGGKMRVPLVIRLIVGRGWGQGPQHSQSLQSIFAHIPGLKVVMPTTPYDAKGLLIASIEDDNPVIFIEHRWLYNLIGNVPQAPYRVPIGQAKVLREGRDLTIVSISQMTLEALRAADRLKEEGIEAEVIDLRTVRPLDEGGILQSVRKTGRLIAADTGWKAFGTSAEILAVVSEKAFDALKAPPVRVALPDSPAPTTPALSNHFYPGSEAILQAAKMTLNLAQSKPAFVKSAIPHDIPDLSFVGPF